MTPRMVCPEFKSLTGLIARLAINDLLAAVIVGGVESNTLPWDLELPGDITGLN